MSYNQRKKAMFISLHDRLNIINALDNSEKVISLASEYCISPSTVSTLKKKRKSLKEVENLNSKIVKKRKVVKPVHNDDLEKAVIMWFNEKRLLGEPVSGLLIQEKALILNKHLKGSDKFKASNGWLGKFKNRHGIRQLSMQGEKLSADEEAAIEFSFNFQDMIQNNYDLSLVFNADESGIYWRRLPQVTLAAANEEHDCPGWKLSKERVIALFCSNADGSFALPLLIIGKSANPRCFKTLETLPVVYKHQSSAWMNSSIFLDWYTNLFRPSVKEMQAKTNKFGKVLLLLDNAKCHPPKEVLDAVDENFVIEYLPPNVTSLIQPMDQGVIVKAKKEYRKDLLRQLILNDKITVKEFLQCFNLKDCCFMLAKAFNSLTQENLKNAWNKIRGVSPLNDKDVQDSNDSTTDLQSMANKVKGLNNVNLTDVGHWLSDERDPGWKKLSDEEIIEAVTGQQQKTIENKKLNDRKILQSIKLNNVPTAKEVNTKLHILHNWCKQKEQYSLSDFRLFSKWENLSMKELDHEL